MATRIVTTLNRLSALVAIVEGRPAARKAKGQNLIDSPPRSALSSRGPKTYLTSATTRSLLQSTLLYRLRSFKQREASQANAEARHRDQARVHYWPGARVRIATTKEGHAFCQAILAMRQREKRSSKCAHPWRRTAIALMGQVQQMVCPQSGTTAARTRSSDRLIDAAPNSSPCLPRSTSKKQRCGGSYPCSD